METIAQWGCNSDSGSQVDLKLDPGVYSLVTSAVEGGTMALQSAALLTRTPQPPQPDANGWLQPTPDLLALELIPSTEFTLAAPAEVRLSWSGRGSAVLYKQEA
jgi:hypothetical protein